MTNRRTFISMAATAAGTTTAMALAPGVKAQGTPARNHAGTIKTRDGAELFVKDWGSGRPVVLTHAWPLSSDCWDHQAVALVEAGYRVIAYDRRGFGRSSQPGSGYNYNTYADDLAAVINSTGAKDSTANKPDGVDPSFFNALKDNLRKDRPTFLAGLLKDVFYDVETSRKSTNPVSQAVLDWSMQMAMQASIRALVESVDAFGKEDFTADLAACRP